MADAASGKWKLIRCPMCLQIHTVEKDIGQREKMECRRCKKSFATGVALPAIEPGKRPPPEVELAGIEIDRTFRTTYMMAGIVGAGVLGLTYIVHEQSDGPSFLKYYFALFVAALVAVCILRYADSVARNTQIHLCSGIFIAAGFERLFLGSMAGMQKFGFLVLGMIFGYFILILVGMFDKIPSGSNSGFSSSSCSTGSGCGGRGGCGGGGGCGGCGGGD